MITENTINFQNKRQKRAAARILSYLTAAAEERLSAGRKLIEAKRTLPTGEWVRMLDAIPLTEKQARELMALARR